MPMSVQPDFDRAAAAKAIHELVGDHARRLSARLHAHRQQLFPPTAHKTLRKFTSGEAAKLLGVDDGYLRRLSLAGKGPTVETVRQGHRLYSADDLQGACRKLPALRFR